MINRIREIAMKRDDLILDEKQKAAGSQPAEAPAEMASIGAPQP
jgi:hypothetical protein